MKINGFCGFFFLSFFASLPQPVSVAGVMQYANVT